MASASTFAARPVSRGRVLVYVFGYAQHHYHDIPRELYRDSPKEAFVDVRDMLPHDPSTRRAKGESLVDSVVKQQGFHDAVIAVVNAAISYSLVWCGSQHHRISLHLWHVHSS